MRGSRQPFVYRNPGDPFDGLPLEIVGQLGSSAGLSGIHVAYFNQFYIWEGPNADSAAPGTNGWIVTSVDGGGDTLESLDILDNAQFGVLRIQTNNADNDNTQLQLNGSSFRYIVGKRLWCFARFALEDVNDGEFAFGLIIETDTDMINTLPTDGIFFEKAETAVDLDFHARKNAASTEKTSALGTTLTDGGFVTVGFLVDVLGNVIPCFNGAMLTAKTIFAGDTKIPDDEDLTFAIQIQTGTTAVRYVDLGWLLLVQER